MSQFEYVAVLISIIVGLALTQILRGLGRIATTKNGPRPYWVHLAWTIYFFLYITFFWWWEFQLSTSDWNLTMYVVLIVYATLLFFVSLILHPGDLGGVTSYKEYYYANRRWLFGLLIALMLWDFADTLTKGTDYFLGMGNIWLLFHVGLIATSAAAIATSNEKFHAFSVFFWLFTSIGLMIQANLIVS